MFMNNQAQASFKIKTMDPPKKNKIRLINVVNNYLPPTQNLYQINPDNPNDKIREKRSISDKTPELRQILTVQGRPQSSQKRKIIIKEIPFDSSHTPQILHGIYGPYQQSDGNQQQNRYGYQQVQQSQQQHPKQYLQQQFSQSQNSQQQHPQISPYKYSQQQYSQQQQQQRQQLVKLLECQNQKNTQLIKHTQNEETNQSRPSTTHQPCYYCGISQSSDFIILDCGHSFHADCLEKLMNQQVDNQLSRIKCTCQKLIPQKICTRYLSPLKNQIYLQIQAQKLAKHNQLNIKWKKCTNHGCDFVFIEMPSRNSKRIQSQCPNCLEKIFGETIKVQK